MLFIIVVGVVTCSVCQLFIIKSPDQLKRITTLEDRILQLERKQDTMQATIASLTLIRDEVKHLREKMAGLEFLNELVGKCCLYHTFM